MLDRSLCQCEEGGYSSNPMWNQLLWLFVKIADSPHKHPFACSALKISLTFCRAKSKDICGDLNSSIFKNPDHCPVFCQHIMKKVIMHICCNGKMKHLLTAEFTTEQWEVKQKMSLEGEETYSLHSRAAVCCQTCGPIRCASVVGACAGRLYVLFPNRSSEGSREQMEALWRIWPLVSPNSSRRRFIKPVTESLS